MKNLGVFIKEKRNEMGLSLREFASKVGLAHSYIDTLEKGKDPRNNKATLPTLDTYIRVANATGYTLQQWLDELGYFDDEKYTIKEIKNEKKSYQSGILG